MNPNKKTVHRTTPQCSVILCSSSIKKIFRFVTIITIILLANNASTMAAAASIISKHHTNKFVASAIRQTNRRGAHQTSTCMTPSDENRPSTSNSISNAAVKSQLSKDMNSINLWNFRSMSNVQVPPSSPSSLMSHHYPHHHHHVIETADSSSDLSQIATTTTRSKNRGMHHRRNTNNDGDTDVMVIAPTSSMSRATKGNAAVDRLNDPNYTLSLEEMRAALGPIGRLVANSVEHSWILHLGWLFRLHYRWCHVIPHPLS